MEPKDGAIGHTVILIPNIVDAVLLEQTSVPMYGIKKQGYIINVKEICR